MDTWEIEYEEPFEKFFRELSDYKQAVLVAAIEHVLTPYGIDICSSEWGKNLGGGLYEFRVRKSLRAIFTSADQELPDALLDMPDDTVLLRVFCTFHGNKVVLLMSGYDKGKDSSKRRQDKEIKRARGFLKKWRDRR